MAERKLGRKAVVHDSRTVRMSRYFTALPAPPQNVDWTKGQTSFGMLRNDVLGDCSIAGIGHAIQVWSQNTSTEATITDDDVQAYYEAWCGYNPADPSTDAGGILLYVLKDFKKDGFVDHRLVGYGAAISSVKTVQQAISLFGGVYIGFNVPQFIMPSDGEPPKVWDVQPGLDNTIVGGHCVFVAGYSTDEFGAVTFKLISWGEVYSMTQAFWAHFVDESYALVGLDWVEPKCPAGLNLTELLSDLAAIN